MTNEDKILKIADQLAVVSRHRIVNLKRGIAELKVRLKGKADRRATEIEKPKRRKAFKAIENGMIQCPWCWVLHGCKGLLEPIGNSNIVRCSSCNHSLFVGKNCFVATCAQETRFDAYVEALKNTWLLAEWTGFPL